jgi:hypothetical protein
VIRGKSGVWSPTSGERDQHRGKGERFHGCEPAFCEAFKSRRPLPAIENRESKILKPRDCLDTSIPCP